MKVVPLHFRIFLSRLDVLCSIGLYSMASCGLSPKSTPHECKNALIRITGPNRSFMRNYATINHVSGKKEKIQDKEIEEGWGSTLFSYFSFMKKNPHHQRGHLHQKDLFSHSFHCYSMPPPCDCRDFEASSPKGLPTANELYQELMHFMEPITASSQSTFSSLSPSASFAWKTTVNARGSSCASASDEESEKSIRKRNFIHGTKNDSEESKEKGIPERDKKQNGSDSSISPPSFPFSNPLPEENKGNNESEDEKAFFSSAFRRRLEQQKLVRRTFFDLTYRCGAGGRCACRSKTTRKESTNSPRSSLDSSTLEGAFSENYPSHSPPSSLLPLPPCRFPSCYTMRPIVKGAEIWQGRQHIEENIMTAWWWRRGEWEKEKNRGDDVDEERASTSTLESRSFLERNQKGMRDHPFRSMAEVVKNRKELERVAKVAGVSFQHFPNALLVECVLKLQPSPLLFPTGSSEEARVEKSEEVSASVHPGTTWVTSPSYYSSNRNAMNEVIDCLESWICSEVSTYVPSFSKQDEEQYFHAQFVLLRSAKKGGMAGTTEEVSPARTLRSEQSYHIPRRPVPSAQAPRTVSTSSFSSSSSSFLTFDETSLKEKEKNSTWGEEVIRLAFWRAALLVNLGRDEEAVRSLIYLAHKLLPLAGDSRKTLSCPSHSRKHQRKNNLSSLSEGDRIANGSVIPISLGSSSSPTSDHPVFQSSPLPKSPSPSVNPLLLRALCETAINWAVLNDMEIITYRSITKQYMTSCSTGSNSSYFFPLGEFFAHDRPLLLSHTFSEVEQVEAWGMIPQSRERTSGSTQPPFSSSLRNALNSPLYQLMDRCAEVVLQKEIVVQVSRLQLASQKKRFRGIDAFPDASLSIDRGEFSEQGGESPGNKSIRSEQKGTTKLPQVKKEQQKKCFQDPKMSPNRSSFSFWFQRWSKMRGRGMGHSRGEQEAQNSLGRHESNDTDGDEYNRCYEGDREEMESQMLEEHPFYSLCVPLTLSYYRFYVHPRFWKHFFTLLCLPPLPAPSSSALTSDENLSVTVTKEKEFATHVLDAVGRSILLYHLITFAEVRSAANEQNKTPPNHNTNRSETSCSQNPCFGKVLKEEEVGIAKEALRALMNVVENHERKEAQKS